MFAGVAHVVHDKLRDDLGWLQNLLQRGQPQNGLQTGGGREQRFARDEGKQVLPISIQKLLMSCLGTSPFQEDNLRTFSQQQSARKSLCGV